MNIPIVGGDIFQLVKKYWFVIALILIVVMGFWIRSLPAKYDELQAIDPFYIYRISEFVVENNFQMPANDYFRHYPFGVPPSGQTPLPFFLPAYMFAIIGPLSGLDFFHFALLYPAIMGALASLVMFFIGRELFDNKTGVLAAFFLATVPAFITRTSAGFFDKEATAGLIMLLVFFFFIRAYKKDSWKSGILGGISMFLLIQTWAGGMQYISMLMPLLLMVILLLNKDVWRISKAYIPLLAGTLLSLVMPYHPAVISLSVYGTIPIFSVFLFIRLGVEKFKLIKEKYLNYVIPAILVVGFVGVLFASMFADVGISYLNEMIHILTLQRNVIFSTVAEANPGDWNVIVGVTKAIHGARAVPLLSGLVDLLSITTFMILGIVTGAAFLFLNFYNVYIKKSETRINFMLMLMLMWVISSIWAVFGFIRLLFLLGPAVSIVAAYFIKNVIDFASNIGPMKKEGMMEKISDAVHRVPSWKRKINYVSVPLAIFIALVVAMNFANAYTYGNGLGPSFHQGWGQAMDYLATQTPEDSNIISWWDFGYWFQTKGKRPTLTDGGWGKRDEVAWWFTANTNNWTDFEPWLIDKYGIDYILMDYTLPGKYGAISKIAYLGNDVVGIPQFNPGQTYVQDGQTIYEYNSPPYYSLWLPMNEDQTSLTGTPIFLEKRGDQILGKAYINNFCGENGITQISQVPQEPQMDGCITMAPAIVGGQVQVVPFYIPPKAQNTIFANLMFMEGNGLPVEKVFDHMLIKIYKVIY